jgi:hypothetical protein
MDRCFVCTDIGLDDCSRATATRISTLRSAAQKHQTDVNALRSITNVTINETRNAPPMVRTIVVEETKNGVTVDITYARRRSPFSRELSPPMWL